MDFNEIEGYGRYWEPDMEAHQAVQEKYEGFISLPVVVNRIYMVVNKFFPATFEEIKSHCRKKEFVLCRHVVIFFIKEKYDYRFSLKFIGKEFGGRDHSTVIHATKAVQNLIDTSQPFRKIIHEIRRELN